MKEILAPVVLRALASGTVAAAAVAGVASFLGRQKTGSYAAALNATSHVLWGEQAAMRNAPSLKYTATGYVANHGASIFWALFYELLGMRGRRTPVRAVADGALVAATAYVVDYHVVPKRFTPGFEKRLPAAGLAAVYAALALGLCLRDLSRR
jgi:hypothetical protein